MSAMDPRTPTRRLRVLLVEDDGDQGRLVSRWLEETGEYTVAHAANGPDGEAMIRSGDWDIVITDIQLPGMSGLDLLRVSKEVLRYTPTLLTTAHERLDYAVQAIRGRADDFLLKPLKREPFLKKVAALVEQGLTERRLHRRVVLAVGAHPDDVEIGCGGIILRHRAEGDEVTVLTLTGGELGGPAPERAEEAQRAAEILPRWSRPGAVLPALCCYRRPGPGSTSGPPGSSKSPSSWLANPGDPGLWLADGQAACLP